MRVVGADVSIAQGLLVTDFMVAITQANRASDVQIKRGAGSVEPAPRPKLTGL